MVELMKFEAVQKALAFLQEDDARTLGETLEMCQIPAPSYQEEKKAEYVFQKMKEAGLEDVHIDEVGNVLGVLKGTGNGPRIILAGHTDTVFPMDTDLTVKKEGNKYSCPGIGDDTRAVAELLSIARVMNAAGLHAEGDIVFCANVCEEGLGDLRGTKHVFRTDGAHVCRDEVHVCKDEANISEAKSELKKLESSDFSRQYSWKDHYDGFVSIDDKNTAGIIYQAVGSERYQVTFHGLGGHSYTGFGIPNPVHAMGRAIAKISDFQVPENPKATFSVGVVNGGTSVNVIAAEASMLVDMRSVDSQALADLSAKFHQAIVEAVQEENTRWGYETQETVVNATSNATSNTISNATSNEASNTISNAISDRKIDSETPCIYATIEQKGKRPAGIQSQDCQIVQAAAAADRAIGMEPLYIGAASTDANIPISLGIPAITIGWGGKGGGEHTVHEWYEQVESWKGPQRDLLLILALAGYQEFRKYQLGNKKNTD